MNIQNYTQKLIQNKKKYIAGWLLLLSVLSVVILYRLFTAEAIIDNSVGVWFDLTDPEIRAYDEYNNTFGEKEWTILLLKTESIYNPNFLTQLHKATQEIEAIDHVVKVTSISNVRDNWVNVGDELDYRVLYPEKEISAGVTKSIPIFKNQLAANPIFDKNLINTNNDQYTMVLVQNHNYIRDPSRYRINIVDAIKRIVEKYDTIEDWGLAGTTVVNAELNRAAQKDVIVFYFLVSTLLTIICWLILRSIKDLCVVLGVVISSVMTTMAFLAALGIPYNMATVMLPPILIALSVAGVLHIITDFHIEHQNRSTEEALRETLSSIWKPAMWAAITTIAGLCSFGFSAVYPIFQIGMFAAFGMLVAWVANMSIAPLLMYIFWHKQKKVPVAKASFEITKDSKNLLAHPWLVSLILVCVLGMLYGLNKAEVDTDYSKFFDDDTRISHSYDLLKEADMGQNPVTIHLKYPEGKEYIESQYIGATLDFEKELKTFPEVVKVLSVLDLITEIDKAYNGKDTTRNRLASYNRSQLSQLFLLGELSGNDDITDFTLKNRNEHQLIVMTPYLSSNELRAFRNNITNIKNKHFPKEVEVIVTGTTVLWANMDTQIIKTQVYSLWVHSHFFVKV